MAEAAPRSEAEDQAAQWFAKLSKPQVTTRDLRAFRTWRQDPANAAAYARLDTTWAAAGALKDDPDLQKLTAEALAKRPPRPDPPKAKVTWVGLGITGAAITSAIALTVLLSPSGPTYRTRTGEQRLVVLADGSRVRLNTDTELQVRYKPRERRILLKRGEAFFEAAHDPTRPFVVVTDDTQVTALGTRFDVRKDATEVRVTLVEGKVQVRTRTQTRTLLPNQHLAATPRGITPPAATDAQADAGWTTGRLSFHDLPLRDAVAEVNRYSPTKVVLDAPAELQEKPVNGIFNVGDTRAFAQAASVLFELKSQDAPGEIRLTPQVQTGPTPQG